MRRALFGVAITVPLMVLSNAAPTEAQTRGMHQVAGVESGDMLKMRAGPGTGYKIVLGLPNGTSVRVHECEQTGSTRWCLVSLGEARALKGYVSAAYLIGL